MIVGLFRRQGGEHRLIHSVAGEFESSHRYLKFKVLERQVQSETETLPYLGALVTSELVLLIILQRHA